MRFVSSFLVSGLAISLLWATGGCSQKPREVATADQPAPSDKPATTARHIRFLDAEHGPTGPGWISLFNGKDQTGWHIRHPDKPNSWTIADGILHNAGGGNDLICDQKFWNFDAYYEYRVPKGSNSGFYLRGRYEIQIYDSFGQPPESHHNGAIYGLVAPSRNMSREANQWQSVYVHMVGRKVTVIMNGEKIIDNFEVTRSTGLELDNDHDKPGPIFLQGDHGQVDFRYVYVKPLP